MTVRIAAQFTKDERDRNGLIPAAGAIAKERHDWTGYAVAKLDCVRVTDEVKDGGVEIPTVGIRHIELLDGEQADAVAKLLAQAYEARTGKTPIPGVDGDQEGDAELLDDGPASPPKDEWLDDGKASQA